MDKIKMLQSRRRALMDAGKGIRKDIEAVIDSESFVELSTFSFSKSEFYDDDAQGEGVVTGFATVNGYPFYVVAQNAAVLSGGIGKANSKKIVKCLESAEKNHTPVIYFLSSLGVRYGEGVSAMTTSLREIPGIGERMETHLRNIGVSCVEELVGRSPEELFELNCKFKGFRDDPCALYVFRLAVYYAENPVRDPAKLKWWYWKDKKYPPES